MVDPVSAANEVMAMVSDKNNNSPSALEQMLGEEFSKHMPEKTALEGVQQFQKTITEPVSKAAKVDPRNPLSALNVEEKVNDYENRVALVVDCLKNIPKTVDKLTS